MKKYFKYILILFIISIGIGLAISFVRKNWKIDIAAQNIIGNTSEVGSNEALSLETASSETKINPKTKFILETKYEDCKHTDTTEHEAPEETINLTQEEFEEKYPEYIVTDFSEEKISLYHLAKGLCNEHFKITVDDENKIIVYKLKSNYDTETYETTDISAEYLSESDQAELKEGIYIYGTSELNSTLENFE